MLQIIEKGNSKLGVWDSEEDHFTIYPSLVDNSISGMNLHSPQLSYENELIFGISGEEILENYDRLPSSFKSTLSKDYSESYFIYVLKIMEK